MSPGVRSILATGLVSVVLVACAACTSRVSRQGPLDDHTEVVLSITFSTDGHLLAAADYPHGFTVWDLNDPDHARRAATPDPDAVAVAVAFQPHRDVVAESVNEGPVIFWDLTDPAHPHRLAAIAAPTDGSSGGALAFSANGSLLAVTAAQDSGQLWDVRDPVHPHPVGAPFGAHHQVSAAAFSPDGHLLALGGGEGTVLYDLSDPAQPRPLSPNLTTYHVECPPQAMHCLGTQDTGTQGALSITPDGHGLALATCAGEVRLYDITTPTRPRLRSQPNAHLNTSATSGGGTCAHPVLFTPDSRIMVAADDDGATTLFDTTDLAAPHPLGSALFAHPPPLNPSLRTVNALALSPDARTLATGGSDGRILFYDITTPNQPHELQ